MRVFGMFVSTILLLIISPIINGFVLTKLWTWFIEPIFNMESIRLIDAVGINVVLGFFLVNTVSETKFKKKDDEEFGEYILRTFITIISIAAVQLLIGWIVSLFM